MATAQAVADRALQMAASFLDQSRDDIVEMVGDDGKLLYEASQIVRQQAGSGGPAAHSVEHLAFSLITAAHEYVRTAGARPAEETG